MVQIKLVVLFSLALQLCFGELGARFDGSGQQVVFQVYSSTATRVEVWLYNQPLNASEVFHTPLSQNASSKIWSLTVPISTLRANGVTGTIYYGYRAWGPNWTFDPAWTKGSGAGFHKDVDPSGNRFNPNKLLTDPYALDVSHDPIVPTSTGKQTDGSVYQSGDEDRNLDSGDVAPKGIVIEVPPAVSTSSKPTRPFKDEIIYEVNLRGFTNADLTVDAQLRGTYAGAAQKAQYLKSLGVTALELLPVQQFQNDANDVVASTDGDNYWGYDPNSYFCPDRRYSFDKSPGGPAKEFKNMVAAFHSAGIKIYVDVVYNHTGEGRVDSTGAGKLLGFRGLDNTTYYEVGGDGASYVDNNGVAPNLNAANPTVRNLILDSLKYWSGALGVDGFRFDLAPLLGNTCDKVCFNFDASVKDNALNRAVSELPLRPDSGGAGVDLIAEPWGGKGDNTYQLGHFPIGWAQWNDQFRDTFRSAQNLLGVENVKPGALATRFAGSSDKFQKPWYSLNFIVAHDGFTLRDLYSYDKKVNDQLWDKGPSDGGNDTNRSWNQDGPPDLQRQAARTGFALLMLSAGVPMMTGGDELYRTQFGNNNMYNVDSPSNWLNYNDPAQPLHLSQYVRKLLAFRNAHPSLRPADFFKGADGNGNSLKDLTWLDAAGKDIVTDQPGYFDDPTQHLLGYRIDGSEFGDTATSICVFYNSWQDPVTVTLPANLGGKKWFRVADTAPWMENEDNFTAPGSEEQLTSPTYSVGARSALLLIEK